MRSSRLPLVATTARCCAFFLCSSCGSRALAPVAPAICQPLPGTSASSSGVIPVSNGTPLPAEALPSPISAVQLQFVAPDLGQEIPLEAPSSFQVRLLSNASLDISLDGGRPRRLAMPTSTIALGQLLAPDATLAPGAHWLFAAAISSSGLVPRAVGFPRAAVARRFFVGKSASSAAGPTGAVWLREPEGTYNGPAAAQNVLFDAYVFSATGAPLDTPSTMTLRGPSVSGELRFPSPFIVHDVPSGNYEVTLSATSALPSSVLFTVNRELGGGP